MVGITPSRAMISDRFPVASFSVQVPAERCFEICFATDPRLYHPDYQPRRSPRNFYTSRAEGLLRAWAGQATYVMPPDQLQRFAGAKRVYYALGTYGSPRGEAAQFTVHPEHLERAPFLKLASDFSGRTLERRRLGAAQNAPAYGRGGAPAALLWGGDQALRAALTANHSASREYDDGFDASLWREPAPGGARFTGSASMLEDEAGEAPEIEDGPWLVPAQAQKGGAWIELAGVGWEVLKEGFKSGSISYQLAQMQGAKYPYDNKDKYGQDNFKEGEVVQADAWIDRGVDTIGIWFDIKWKYNGSSVANVEMLKRKINDAWTKWNLTVETSLIPDATVYQRKTGGPVYSKVRITNTYEFKHWLWGSKIAREIVTLSGDGRHGYSFKWTQE